MRIAILAKPNRKNGAERLRDAAIAAGHTADIVDYTKCYCNIEKSNPRIFLNNQELPKYDAIIPRISIATQSYGSVIIRQFEMMNVFSTTGSLAFIRTRDKLRSMQLLARYNLDIPKTAFARATKNVDDLIDMVGGIPVIIKVVKGSQGIGVLLAETRKTAKSTIQAFISQKVNILVQEYIAESKGTDIRVVIVGGKVVGAMKRQSLDEDEFRSNINLGAKGVPVKLTKREETVALRAAKAMHLSSVAGVDLLRSNRGPLVMEVNAFPMLEGIEASTGKDIAGEIISYIERSVSKKPKRDKVGA